MARKGKNKECVAIARDVIAQVRAGQLVATPGIYCQFNSTLPVGDLQVNLKQNVCWVCGIGAAFISAIRLFDGHQLLEPRFSVLSYDIVHLLRTYFTPREVKRLEVYFEGFGDAMTFAKRHPDPARRLIVLMRSIIANHGHLRVGKLRVKQRVRKSRQ